MNVLDKLNDKELQKVVEKMIEIKEETAREEGQNYEEPMDNGVTLIPDEDASTTI